MREEIDESIHTSSTPREPGGEETQPPGKFSVNAPTGRIRAKYNPIPNQRRRLITCG